jgi:hypothetical protein
MELKQGICKRKVASKSEHFLIFYAGIVHVLNLNGIKIDETCQSCYAAPESINYFVTLSL